MNIGFEAKRFFTNYTGLGNYSRFIVGALSASYPQDHYYLFTPRLKAHPEVTPLIDRENISVVTPPAFYKMLKLSGVWRSWGMSHDATMEDLSIFHGLSQELPLQLPRTVKKVVTVHDLIFLRYPQFYNPIDVRIYRAKVKSACLRADKVVAISEQTAHDLEEFLKISRNNIDVIYQGCHPNFHRTVTEAEVKTIKEKYRLPENYLLNVGTIEERKNLLLLIDAMGQMSPSDRIPLVVVGRKTSYFDQVLQRATELGILNMITFLHQASFADFPAIYRGASVFIYPSLFEGFGIPLIEAIASGLPVITSTGSCFKEAAGPDAVYVDPHRAGMLAAELTRLLRDEATRRRMITGSKEYIQRFNPEVIAANLHACYQRLG
jgi:glycosyltransferase involved in cell wall biosynthesis